MGSAVPSQVWHDTINQANKTALLAWVKETGIQLVQVNGQRKYGGPPPGWVGSAPPFGSEVFIGKIPQDIYEDKLIPVFHRVGTLYEFRLMMTFSGLNRGFAYAKYTNRCAAKEAITLLNNFEIQPGCPILVCRSTDKCELSIDGLDPSVKKHQLLLMLQELTAGLLSLSLHSSPFRKQKQFAELKYVSHQAAAMAKKALVEGSLCLCGDQIAVDWLKPNIKHEIRSVSVQVAPETKLPRSSGRQSSSQELLVPADSPTSRAESSVLEYLNFQCERRHLGTPVFLTKCMQRNSEGYQQFWYQVVIPKYHTPFSGLFWIKPDQSGLEDHERAKNVLAWQLLKVMGCPVV